MLSVSLIASVTACVISASSVNNIKPELLLSVMAVEGGQPGSVSVNKNGSQDLGVMQINTRAWLNLVSQTFFNGDNQSAYTKLKDDACFNISVGAWILRHSIII
ncbi:TPA: lytic transglycosylase domain-containing protein, partial [Escherichia coli]|nr:lytic transglycosylase domain-containing protein [Escherichia coli]